MQCIRSALCRKAGIFKYSLYRHTTSRMQLFIIINLWSNKTVRRSGYGVIWLCARTLGRDKTLSEPHPDLGPLRT